MKLPKIGAVVVNYNNPSDTRETLKSLLRFSTNQEGFGLAIYLVNNGCTDPESSRLVEQFPHVVQIVSNTNLGFAGGNNLGLKKALKDGCSHVLFINNDATIISHDFFEKMLLSGFSITSPLIEYTQNGKTVHDYGGKIDYLFGRNTHILSPGKADYYSGACLFTKSEVFKKIRGFDEAFFLYYEDVDFCLKAKEAGFAIGLLTSVKIFHRLSSSTNKLGAKKIKILAKSHLLFCRRYLPVISFPFYSLFNLYLNSKRIPEFLKAKKTELNQSLYPTLNRLFCIFLKIPEFHLIGDSHVWNYESTHPFIVHHLGAATAFNLGSQNSLTGSYQKLQITLNKINKRSSVIIFELGEIDCRLHIYHQYRKKNRTKSIKQIIDKTVSNYLRVVGETEGKGFKVAILSPTPTGIEQNIYQKEFFANLKKRDQITLQFHRVLREKAEKRGIIYLDLYSLVASKNGGIKEKFRQDEVHLNSAVIPLTLRLLRAKQLYQL